MSKMITTRPVLDDSKTSNAQYDPSLLLFKEKSDLKLCPRDSVKPIVIC